jgi:broad specificity phosphatase PhoE
MEVVLVRHGETEWNRTLQHTGRTDIPLTDDGRRQAERLAGALRERSFALVLTSPLQRARETARLAGFPEAQPRDELMEWDYGDYEGRTTVAIRKEVPGWTVWDGVPNGESPEQVGERADRVIEEIRAVDRDVAIFSHGHFLRVFGARWVGLAAQEGRVLALGSATLSTVGYERETPVIRLWNAPVE